MGRLRQNLNFGVKTPRKAKATRTLQPVVECDCCRRSLRRTFMRAYGSAICAASEGLFVRFPKDTQDRDGYRFYCSQACREADR